MCPIVPTFTCGFVLSNFFFDIAHLLVIHGIPAGVLSSVDVI